MKTMKAVVFRGKDDIRLEEVPRPVAGPGEAVIRITTTTICGTDVHIVRGEYPVKPASSSATSRLASLRSSAPDSTGDYHVGQRVIVGAITPCGQCFYCLNGAHSQCGGRSAAGASGTPSTGPGRNTCWSRTRARTSRRFPRASRRTGDADS